MFVYTVTSLSSLGRDEREFTSERQLLHWINVLSRNDVAYYVTYRRVGGSEQLEFNF